jgi:membrane-associated phospholipid phosphatase
MTEIVARPDRRTTRRLVALGLAVIALVAATALDQWAYRVLVLPDVYDRDWGRMLRIAGFLPTWATVSAALLLCAPPSVARSKAARWRALSPLIAATVGGLAAELLKLLFRRERPDAYAGAYVFRSWHDHPLSTSGLALPSSHALVAFTAAAMLARMCPRARWLWFGVAAGCALTRVLARAHFLSDVTLSAIVAWPLAAAVAHWTLQRTATDEARGTDSPD